MPPNTIRLVSLKEGATFENVDVPQNVVCKYVEVNKTFRTVSGETTSALLNQIAGLTSLLETRSLEARDILLNMTRIHEINILDKEMEIERLQHLLTSQMKESMTTKVGRVAETNTGMGGCWGFKQHQISWDNSTDSVSYNRTGFTSDSKDSIDGGTSFLDDVRYSSHVAGQADEETTTRSPFPYISTDVLEHGTRYKTFSEKGDDIIYGMDNRTRSC
ncbi:uncharacterized protein LOC126795974 [Argentina anserina]|uniref:uncharacterized protein LOC126795974 n=1 Tax=Argentina anserina TaxID=57926 RepID=UPI0021767DC1|nr:uncharacterized protein LOC126795974 [Potentilla anserina]